MERGSTHQRCQEQGMALHLQGVPLIILVWKRWLCRVGLGRTWCYIAKGMLSNGGVCLGSLGYTLIQPAEYSAYWPNKLVFGWDPLAKVSEITHWFSFPTNKTAKQNNTQQTMDNLRYPQRVDFFVGSCMSSPFSHRNLNHFNSYTIYPQ